MNDARSEKHQIGKTVFMRRLWLLEDS